MLVGAVDDAAGVIAGFGAVVIGIVNRRFTVAMLGVERTPVLAAEAAAVLPAKPSHGRTRRIRWPDVAYA